MKRLVAGVSLAVVLMMAMSQVQGVFGQSNPSVELKIVNETSVDLLPSIDDLRRGVINHRDQGIYIVPIGQHLISVADKNGNSASLKVNVPAGGYIWTVYDADKAGSMIDSTEKGKSSSILKKDKPGE